MDRTNIAIVVGTRGRGSNMVALATQIAASPDLRVCAVVTPRMDTDAVRAAVGLGLEVRDVPYGQDYAQRLGESLTDAEWVCLAGYTKLFPVEVLAQHPNRVLNIHPALLPKFGGAGMYGMNVHRAVIEAGEKESGCTVHYVSDQYDEGAVIVQRSCPVEPGWEPEDLAAEVLRLEHQAFYAALRKAISDQS